MIRPDEEIEVTLDELAEAMYRRRHADFDVEPIPWEEQGSTAYDVARARALFEELRRVQTARVYAAIGRLTTEEERRNTEPCFSLGPRIGGEGRPLCLKPNYHEGPHRGYEGSGFEREQWGDPKMRDGRLVRDWQAGDRQFEVQW